jgi:hypothetical protein
VATQSTSERVKLRQAAHGVSVRSEPVAPSRAETAAETTAEPVAQWKDNVGDRVTYLLWLVCFAAMALYVLVETVMGFLF